MLCKCIRTGAKFIISPISCRFRGRDAGTLLRLCVGGFDHPYGFGEPDRNLDAGSSDESDQRLGGLSGLRARNLQPDSLDAYVRR